METTMTILKEHAPSAVIVLLAVFFLNQENEDLRRQVSEGLTNVRAEISGLSERMARVETKVDNIDQRTSRVETKVDNIEQRASRIEGILDSQRPPATK